MDWIGLSVIINVMCSDSIPGFHPNGVPHDDGSDGPSGVLGLHIPVVVPLPRAFVRVGCPRDDAHLLPRFIPLAIFEQPNAHSNLSE